MSAALVLRPAGSIRSCNAILVFATALALAAGARRLTALTLMLYVYGLPRRRSDPAWRKRR